MMPRQLLHARPEVAESALVVEAKRVAREVGFDGDPHMVAFALALIEQRNTWQPRR